MLEDERRLSAILAADVVGYTKRMEQDTEGTVKAWKSARTSIVDPTIFSFSGRIVKHTGDGFLAEFNTVLDAVNCAVEMQAALASSVLKFRMGINLGDIIDDGEDIHGEGVNLFYGIRYGPNLEFAAIVITEGAGVIGATAG